MTELSLEMSAKSHKLQTTVLQMLADVSQQEVAARAGMDDATVSRWKSEDCGLLKAARIIAGCGGKVVPEDAVVVDALEYRMLCQIAAVYYRNKAG